MFNRKMQYVIKSVPSEDKQMLEDLLNEMSIEGWDLYSMHEQENEDAEYFYNCIFMKEREAEEENEDYDQIVKVNSFKSQMEKMLYSTSQTPYETCREISQKIKEQKKKISQIKSNLEKEELSARDALNTQMSEAIEKLEQLKQNLSRELSPAAMYSRIGAEKFTLNLSEELIDFVTPEGENDLLSETVKLRQKLTDELGYVLPSIIFKDDDSLSPYEFCLKVHSMEVYKSTILPEHKAFFKSDLNIKKPAKTIVVKDIITDQEIWWIPNELCKDFWTDGFSAVEYIIRAIEFVGLKYVSEILDYNDINRYISLVEKHNPFVINNIIPDFLTIPELKYVIINLIKERVSIKDIDYIFEKINDFSDEPSRDCLLDKIRLSLSKHIIKGLVDENNEIQVVTFSPQTIDTIFKLVDSDDEAVIRVDGKVAGKIAKKIKKLMKENSLNHVIIEVPMEIRHMTYTIFSEFLNNITVVATEELSSNITVGVIDEI